MKPINNFVVSTVLMILFSFNIPASNAADMGGELRLKDDSKQELKNNLNELKNIFNNYNFLFTPLDKREDNFEKTQKFEFSGCKIKYSEIFKFGNKTRNRQSTFNLNDIENIDFINFVKDVFSEGNNINVDTVKISISAKDFDKSIFISGDVYSSEYYYDNTSFHVLKNDAGHIKKLLEESIDICSDI